MLCNTFLEFSKYVQTHYQFWGNIIHAVVVSKKPYLLIFYDDLKKDPVIQMRRVAEFLAKNNFYSISNLDNRLLCLSQSLRGAAKRNPSKLNFDPFTSDMKILIDQMVEDAKKLFNEKDAKTIGTFTY